MSSDSNEEKKDPQENLSDDQIETLGINHPSQSESVGRLKSKVSEHHASTQGDKSYEGHTKKLQKLMESNKKLIE